MAAIASFVLAIACLAAAFHHTQLLVPLLEKGKRTRAEVTGVHRGARTTRWTIYRYTTADDKVVTARDLFQMYIKRLHKGDRVTVIFDPDDTGKVTADLGLWIWQGPVIFFSGFVFLAVLGIMILYFKPGKGKQ